MFREYGLKVVGKKHCVLGKERELAVRSTSGSSGGSEEIGDRCGVANS